MYNVDVRFIIVPEQYYIGRSKQQSGRVVPWDPNPSIMKRIAVSHKFLVSHSRILFENNVGS